MAAVGFQCSVSASSTSQWLIFLCFTPSLPPSLPHSSLCRSVQFNPIQLDWFYWHEMWHVSPKHAPTETDQSLHKSRCQPSLHCSLFTLATLLSVSLSLIYFSDLLSTIRILTPPILSHPCLFSLPFSLHRLSLSASLEHDKPCVYLTVMALAGLRNMKVNWVGEGST